MVVYRGIESTYNLDGKVHNAFRQAQIVKAGNDIGGLTMKAGVYYTLMDISGDLKKILRGHSLILDIVKSETTLIMEFQIPLQDRAMVGIVG